MKPCNTKPCPCGFRVSTVGDVSNCNIYSYHNLEDCPSYTPEPEKSEIMDVKESIEKWGSGKLATSDTIRILADHIIDLTKRLDKLEDGK